MTKLTNKYEQFSDLLSILLKQVDPESLKELHPTLLSDIDESQAALEEILYCDTEEVLFDDDLEDDWLEPYIEVEDDFYSAWNTAYAN